MTLGSGIAIAGVWIFVGMLAMSRTMTSFGLLIGIGIAGLITYKLIS